MNYLITGKGIDKTFLVQGVAYCLDEAIDRAKKYFEMEEVTNVTINKILT
jgi:hypothetical protein